MTTIAYRNGILASDSRETACDGHHAYVITDTNTKIQRLHTAHGRRLLFAGGGNSEEVEIIRRSVLEGREPPELESAEALIVDEADDRCCLYEGHIWIEVKEPFYAIGTGAPYALAAMRAGADAIQAAEIGTAMDPNSGGDTQYLTTDKHKGVDQDSVIDRPISELDSDFPSDLQTAS